MLLLGVIPPEQKVVVILCEVGCLREDVLLEYSVECFELD